MIIGADEPLTSGNAYVDSCTFTGNSGQVYISGSSLLINSIIDNGLYASGGKIINNTIKGYISVHTTTFTNNSLNNAYISFDSSDTPIITSNIFNSCSIYFAGYLYNNSKFNNNNFIGFNDVILNISNCSYSNNKSFNFTGNYWGQAQTAELESKLGTNIPDDQKDYNMSFITDYYDNFEYTKIDYSNWAKNPIEGVGYLGDGFIAFDYTINGYNFDSNNYYPESTDPQLSIVVNPKYHANEISYIRIAQSLGALKNATWTAYNANQSFTADLNSLVDGLATIYVQLKDSKGNLSSPVVHEVPFDKPVVNLSITDGTEYSQATSSVTLNYSATDKGNLTQYKLYLDDEIVSSNENSSGWGKSCSRNYTLGLAYMVSGNHKIKCDFYDVARNYVSKEITFKINRDVDTSVYAGTSYDATTGQLLKDENTIYLWHLDGNCNEVSGNEELSLTSSSSFGTGGLGGYANHVSTSNKIPLNLDNAFSIEFWRKGSSSPNIYKSNVFDIGYYFYRYYTTAGGSSAYNYINTDYSSSGWHFWTYVYDGNYMAIYCDGVIRNYTEGLTQELNTNDNKLYISSNGNKLDELRISKTARTVDEIATYYKAAKDKFIEE